jgi:hypothetical protein
MTMQTWSSKSPPNSQLGKTSTSTKATWVVEDESKLLSFLQDHTGMGTDGDMFKPHVFKQAAVVLNESLSKGAPKTDCSCRNKYKSV